MRLLLRTAQLPASRARTVPGRRLGAPERGALSLEWAVIFPLVLLLTFGGVQVAFWYQARSMCQAAAQAGTRAARVPNASTGAGRAAANDYLAATAGDTVVRPRVRESRTATAVTVGCSGTALQVMPLPGLPLNVAQSATAPRERFSHR